MLQNATLSFDIGLSRVKIILWSVKESLRLVLNEVRITYLASTVSQWKEWALDITSGIPVSYNDGTHTLLTH